MLHLKTASEAERAPLRQRPGGAWATIVGRYQTETQLVFANVARDQSNTRHRALAAKGEGCLKVVVNWGLCDGNGVCSAEAPEVFEIDDDDNLILLQTDFPAALLPKVQAAASACPKRAITIDD